MNEVVEPRLDKRRTYAQVTVVAIAWLAFVIYVASIYDLPDIIPVHFGLDGVPNRFGKARK